MLSKDFYSLGGNKLMPRVSGAIFITIEGSDGAGKTTQANLLKEYFESKGNNVLLTKEPTVNTEIGNKIKRILYGEEPMPSPKDFQKLYIEDRKNHIAEEIMPALLRGEIVICDRYAFATFAHAMLDLDDISELIELSQSFLMPDLAIMLLTDPQICIDRLGEKGRKLDYFEDISKIEKIDKNYRKLANDFDCIKIVSSNPSIGRVHEEVIKIVENVIK